MSQGVKEIELWTGLPDHVAERGAGVDAGVGSRLAAALHMLRQVLPVVIGAMLILSVMFLIARVRFLAGFGADFSGSGAFQVTHCESLGGAGGQWRCDGSLTVDGRLEEVSSLLVTSKASVTSDRPYVGEMVDVFYRPGDSTTVFPRAARLGELTRLYVQLVPITLLAVGSFFWFLGWVGAVAGSRSDRQLVIVERGHRLQPAWAAAGVGLGPLRVMSVGSLKRRGWAWILSGLALSVGVALLGRLVLGSLGFP